MKEQTEKSPLVAFKEDSIRLRNELESEKNVHKKSVLRLKLNSAKFWERLIEDLIFILLIAILLGGCISNTLDGMRQDIHNASRPADQAKWTK